MKIRASLISAAIGLSVLTAAPAFAQFGNAPSKDEWFGLARTIPLTNPTVMPNRSLSYSIPPVIIPQGDTPRPDLKGLPIAVDVDAIVNFSREMHRTSQMWGRISGFPSEARAAEYVGDAFRKAGLKQVAVQTYKSTADFWWPDAWEVTLKADPGYGAASRDIELASAVPTARSKLDKAVTAPLVFVGDVGPTPPTMDVKGAIAVQRLAPGPSAYAARSQVREASSALIKAGAVAVLNWIDQSGNMHVYDFGGCGGACFNIGHADGLFLKQASERAAAAGAPPLKMSVSLTTSNKSGLTARNTIGVIPGKSDEIIIVNAHLDAWFDGAGDNADGVGVMLALARHFAKPVNKPDRTLLFVGSGGHHSGGMNGPQNVVSMNPALMKRVKLVINLEHLAQYEVKSDPWSVKPTEQSKGFGVSNMSPFLVNLVKTASARYGFVINPEVTASVPGDLGGYAPLNVARMQGIHSGPLYHTSGDVLDSLSLQGLERAARFYAYLIEQAGKAGAKEINP